MVARAQGVACGVVAAQPGRAALAAAIASAACAASACANSPTTSVTSEGLMLALALAPSRHSPLMKFLCMVMVNSFAWGQGAWLSG